LRPQANTKRKNHSLQHSSAHRAKAQKQSKTMAQKPNVLMLGTGEYTTGWVGKASDSDKSTGVVALVVLDLKRRNKINDLAMCGTSGPKLPQIREHMRKMLGVYEGIDPSIVKTFPADDVVDREAYKGAISTLKKGDCAIIFTPDDTHFSIAEHCIKHGIHVMITKPPVKTLEEHNKLAALAKEQGVLCCIEVHKRYDPIYRDARDRIQQLGAFSFFQAYMSQPKHQLETFKVSKRRPFARGASIVRLRRSRRWRAGGVNARERDAAMPWSEGHPRHALHAVAARREREDAIAATQHREPRKQRAKNDAGLGRQVVGHFLLSKLAPRRLPRVVLFWQGAAGTSGSPIVNRRRPSKIGKTLRGHDHAERPVAHASHERPGPRVVHVVVGRAEGRRPQPTAVVLHGSIWGSDRRPGP
jgi:hypothetical protein